MKKFFLIFSAILFFSLPYHTAIKYISLGLVLLSGLYIIIKEKTFKFDLITLSLLGFFLIVLLSGFIHLVDLKRTISAQKDMLLIVMGFIVYRFVPLSKEEIIKYIVIPLSLSSIILLFVGLYKFYVLHDYYRFHLFTNINRSAIYAALSFAFLLPFLEELKNKKVLLIAALFCLLATIVFLASRNSIITTSIILLLYLIAFSSLDKSKKIFILFLAIIIVIIVALFYHQFLYKIEHITKVPYRFGIWQAGISTYIESKNYLLGIGTTNFREVDLTPFISNWFKHIGSAHNLFLEILIENGILGLFAYLLFLFLILKKIFKYKKSIFFLSSLFLIIVHFLTSMTETTLMKEHGFLFMALLGVSLGFMERNYEN